MNIVLIAHNCSRLGQWNKNPK